MDDSHTPRSLVESLINQSKVDKTVRIGPELLQTKGKKRTLSENDVGENKQKVKNLTLSDSTITPRTMIEGLTHGEDSVQHSTRVARRQRLESRKHTTSTSSANDIKSSPRTTKKNGNLRKKATMQYFLNQSANSGPTPRGMIEEFLNQGAECTPVAHEGESDIGHLHTTQIDDLMSRKRRISSLGESYYLPSTAPELTDTAKPGKKGRRQKFDPEEFAKQLAHRRESQDERTKDISITNTLAEMHPDQSVNTATTRGYEKTEELKRVLSSRHVTMTTPGAEMSMFSVNELETPPSNLSPTNSRTKKGSASETTSLSETVETSFLENIATKVKSPRRSSRRTSVAAGISSLSLSPAGNTSKRQSSQISEASTSAHMMGTGGRSRYSSKSHTKSMQLTNVTSLHEGTPPVSKGVEEMTERVISEEDQEKNEEMQEENSEDENEDVDEDDQDDDQADSEDDSEEVPEHDQSAHDNEDVLEHDQSGNENMPANESNEHLFVQDDTHRSTLSTDRSSLSGYDTMRTPHLRTTPARSSHHAQPSTSGLITSAKILQQSKQAAKKSAQTKKNKAKDTNPPRMPRSCTKKIFSHFSKFKVSKQALDEVEKVSDEYWKNLTCDLTAYVKHANRNTIDESDMELLFRRQGFVTDTQSLHTLIAKYLPLEYRTELIPIARSGNVVYPKL